MKAKAVVQMLPNGERHAAFATKLDTPTNDMLIRSGGWEKAKVVEGEVLIVGQSPDIENALGDSDFFTLTGHQIKEEEECLST